MYATSVVFPDIADVMIDFFGSFGFGSGSKLLWSWSWFFLLLDFF